MNKSTEVHLQHSLRLFYQEIRLLPILPFACIFSCIIVYCNTYFSPLITWTRYCNFLILIAFITSFSCFILLEISTFITKYTQLILCTLVLLRKSTFRMVSGGHLLISVKSRLASLSTSHPYFLCRIVVLTNNLTKISLFFYFYWHPCYIELVLLMYFWNIHKFCLLNCKC